jgi:hemerythrin-like domain-containing protein
MDLIAQLKEEHVQIVRLFEETESYASGKNPNGSNLNSSMNEWKEVLIQHLKLEDEALYPKFKNSESEECKNLGEKFSEEMSTISKAALVFFDKYNSTESSDLINNEEFVNELAEIINVIKKRVEVEETILFPAFGKC